MTINLLRNADKQLKLLLGDDIHFADLLNEEDHGSLHDTIGGHLAPSPALYYNPLRPPDDALFWRHRTLFPMRQADLNCELKVGSITIGVLAESVTWQIDAYVYTVDALPNADFERNGGSVYVVLVSTGAASTGNIVGKTMEYRFSILLSIGSGSALLHLPLTGSGTPDGPRWDYQIDFNDELAMFRGKTADPFTFAANYEARLTHWNGQQTGSVEPKEVQWGIKFGAPVSLEDPQCAS
ncbi:hypothetical protein ONZ45_g15465 [Pleurotus djamor]|nr:hypothetical protein ONZ45_g15465 [Pleurotus djamor]